MCIVAVGRLHTFLSQQTQDNKREKVWTVWLNVNKHAALCQVVDKKVYLNASKIAIKFKPNKIVNHQLLKLMFKHDTVD